jgi:TolB protein
MPRLFWVMVGSATVLAIFLVLFLALRGVQDGRRQVEAQQRQQIAIYLQAADDALAEGNPFAALDAYRQVLILDPNNQDAVNGIRGLPIESVSMALPTATPTPPPTPIPTPTPEDTLALVWADAQQRYSAGQWAEAIDLLRQLRLGDPDFQAGDVEEMLYMAFITLATERLNSGSLEEAVSLFDRALELRPNAADIRQTRDVTADYVDALTYWFADWEQVIELLSELYQSNPGYRDVRQRLQTAHMEYGDLLARQGEWCAAAQEYTAAIQVQNAPGLQAKQVEFQTLCTEGPAQAAAETPDPSGLNGAAPVPTAQSSTAAPGAASGGLGVGRILYSAQDVVDGRYRIYAQPVAASVRPVVLVEDAMQPSLRGDGQRLAFRNMRGDARGVGSFDPATSLRLRFTAFAEDNDPSWSPDGNQLVFASNREGDRRWRIYTVWADGNDNGTSLVFGQYPDWHPSQDLIVYKGCDERGNRCGLWTMNSGGGNQNQLTSVPGDSHPAWSPDGRFVVFMSAERDGNWEIYRVEVQSGAITRLTNSPGIDGIPTVSPDGSRVAFLSNRDGSWDIWVMPITGGTAQKLAPITGALPDWFESVIRWVL